MTDHFDGWPGDDAGWPGDDGPDDDRPGDPAGYGDDWDHPDPGWDPDGRYGDPEPEYGGQPAGEAEPIGYGGDTAAYPADPTGADDPDGDPPADTPAGTPLPGEFPVSDTLAGGDSPFGADPDLPRHGDDWHGDDWPTGGPEPAQWSGPPPEPVDGFPWTDPDTLGAGAEPDGGWTWPTGAPDPAELAEYAGEPLPPGTDPWRALADSADPATGALARFWAPGSTPPP